MLKISISIFMAKTPSKTKTPHKTRINVFVDSDAFIAFMKKDDTLHSKAVKYFKKLSDQDVHFLTSNYVFSEVITVASQRISRSAALQFIETVRSAQNPFDIRIVDQETNDLAVDIFQVQKSKNVSFVDCANMAIMTRYRLQAIFSFDMIYQKNGFKTMVDV